MPEPIVLSEEEALHLVLPLAMWLLSEEPDSLLIQPRILRPEDPAANTRAVADVFRRILESRGGDAEKVLNTLKKVIHSKEGGYILDSILNRIDSH